MRSSRIISVIKRELKRQGLNYRQVAQALELSEAAVKRMFSQGNFSLIRLEEICRFLGLDEHELLRRVAQDTEDSPPSLSIEQESALANNRTLIVLFYYLIVGKSMTEIKHELKVDEKGLFSLLQELDQLELLELHAKNRVRLKVSKAPKWLPDGPLVTQFGRAALKHFIDSRFQEEQELHDFHTGTLTNESFILFKRKLQELFKEFDESAHLDRNLEGIPVTTFWFYGGVRPWDPIGLLKRVQKL